MTLLIVVECNLNGIKRDFFLYGYELSHFIACTFPDHYMSEFLMTSNKITRKWSNR